MDWFSVARLLAENALPTAVLDAELRVCLVNKKLELLLGCPRERLEGLPLEATCMGPALRGLLVRTMSDVQCSGTYRVVTDDARHLDLDLATTRIGEGGAAMLLLTVRASHEWSRSMSNDEVLEYDVGGTVTDFGTLASVRTNTGVQRYFARDAPRCHEAIYGQGSPCADCPIIRFERRGTASASFCTSGAGAAAQIATVERAADVVRIRVRRMAAGAVQSILDLVLEDVVADTLFTHRERNVLEHLLAGHTTATIAELLSMDARSVRHHQANVIKKLGAGSLGERFRRLR